MPSAAAPPCPRRVELRQEQQRDAGDAERRGDEQRAARSGAPNAMRMPIGVMNTIVENTTATRPDDDDALGPVDAGCS